MTFLAALMFLTSTISLADSKVERSRTKTFECPAKIDPGVGGNSNPWDIILAVNQPNPAGPYINEAVYDGHPREMASLVPDIDQTPPKPSTWKLDSTSDRYWLGCLYKGTDAKYGLNLPPGFSKCSSFDGSGKGGFKCSYAGKKK